MEKNKKILFKSMSIILSVAMLSIGLLTLNNDGIIKLENQKEKPEALTSGFVTEFNYISAGGNSNRNLSMVIDKDGTLWSWTKNGEARKINTQRKFTKVEVGWNHNIAIDTSGNLYTWGYNYNGMLGTGGTNESFETYPAQIMQDIKFKEISVDMHNLAIDTDGYLWAWGRNDYGQVGKGSTEDCYTPTKIKSDVRFSKVAAGRSHSLAIDTSGNLWAWGSWTAPLGLEATDNVLTPRKLSTDIKFKEISTSDHNSMAIDVNGNLYTWGSNSYGQLGNENKNISNVNQPTQIKKGVIFDKIAAGSDYSMAIDSEGNLWTWGANGSGQLGNGSTTNSNVPIKIKEGTKFTQITDGYDFSMAIDTNKNIWVWGANGLGNDIVQDSTEPIQIKKDSTFKRTSAGENHSMAITEEGKLLVWGNNSNGQLGISGVINTSIPTELMKEKTFNEVAAGNGHSMAIDSEGNLWTWGANGSGQLGNGNTTNSNVPIQIMEGTIFKKISAGNGHSMAIDSERKFMDMGK